jgi:hypothetical protein
MDPTRQEAFSKEGKVVTACIDVVEGGKWTGKSSSEGGLVGRRHLVVGHDIALRSSKQGFRLLSVK